MKKIKTIFGAGINDADYKVSHNVKINGVNKRLWTCPFYSKWKDMLMRCYSEKYKMTHPRYEGCYVVESWLKFSSFKSWMEKQDWKDKQLDKDILFPGNKEYGPETAVFVDAIVNYFVTDRVDDSNGLPTGACYHKGAKKFISSCKDVTTNTLKHLGYFSDPWDAHLAWLNYKIDQAKILASKQSDQRVAKAIVDRYENYNQGGYRA